MSERAKILKLTARNVKRIQEVIIDEIGDLHEVRGDADQGKTSILDAIQAALEGMDKSMVRRDAESAELELVLSEGTIKRIINAGDGKETLMVTDKAGKAVEKAKDFLRTICNPSTFRPLSWVQLGGGDKKGLTERRRMQRDQLLEALDVSLDADKVFQIIERNLGEDYIAAMEQVRLDGVDFDQHPFAVCRAFERAVYDYRKLKAAEAEKAGEVLRNTPAPSIAAPKDDLATCRAKEAAAVEAYHTAKATAGSRAAVTERAAVLRERIARAEAELPEPAKLAKTKAHHTEQKASLETKIQEVQAELARLQESHAEASRAVWKCEEIEQQIEKHAADVADLAEVEGQLCASGESVDLAALEKAKDHRAELTKARELQDRHDQAAADAAEAEAVVEVFKGLVELFRDGLPRQLLAEANLPVKGLSVDGDQILIDDVPLHQLGTSKQIRLGVLIAHALNPRSAFVLVDGAESMGKADRKALADTAAELGLQLIMTFVDPEAKPKAGVTVMEDGRALAS